MSTMAKTLKERLRLHGRDAFGQFFLAVFSLIVLLTPLSGYLESPALWVLSDFAAAVFIMMILMAKNDWFGKIYATIMFVCIVVLCLYLLIEGIVIASALFVAWCWRSYASIKQGHSRALGEIIRSTCAIMVAGIPTMIVFSWSGPELAIIGTLSILFFMANGGLYLYPPGEWLVDTEGSSRDQ